MTQRAQRRSGTAGKTTGA